ncbi:hypothetical protein Tco_1129762, partial [Tanacetum coccineum]
GKIQQLQKHAKILKENSLNKLNALQTTIQHLSSSNYSMYYEFRDAFHRLFKANKRTFKSVLSRNMQHLERQLNKETLYEKDYNSDLRVIKVQFDQFIHSKVLEPSNYNSYDLETRRDFKHYTQMEPQTFKEAIIQNIDSIEQCIVERARHEQEIQNRLKRLNERKLQIQECMVQKNDQGLENQSNTSGYESSRSRNECNDKSNSGDDTDIRPSYDTESMVENDQGLENQSNTSGYESSMSRNECNDKSNSRDDTDIRPSYDTESMVEVDSNVIPDSPDMCDNEIQTDHNVVECDDERVALAKLIENLKVIHRTNVSRPQLRITQIKDKVVPNNSHVKDKKTEVEDHHRISSISNKTKSVTASNDSLKSRTSNVNAVCATCGKCVFNSNHDAFIVQFILFIVDSGCTKHMTGNLTLLCNFVEKYLGTVRFGNDQFAPILSYRDLVQGNITINRVYYVEGLNHNLFPVGQFYDANLEVAFLKSTCFVRDLQGNDLLIGNRRSDLYIISLQETTSSTPLCLMAKASPNQDHLTYC